jgi:hypothetical protein
MKTWALIISIIVILAIFCSPALAISKSDLISQYKTGQFPETTHQTSTPTPQMPSSDVNPTPSTNSDDRCFGYGSLSITSDPEGALVYLDGRLKGTTPITITGVHQYKGCKVDSTGKWLGWIGGLMTYDIKITKRGYQDYIISDVLVTAGKTTSFSATLTPISVTKSPANIPTAKPTQTPTGTTTGTLSVRSSPPGAPVIIDGVYKGMTPVTLNGVSAGVHQVSVTLNGIDVHSTWVRILPRNWGVNTVDVTEQGEAVGFAILEG